MFQGAEHIHNTTEALGTLWAGKSVALVGAVTAMRERVEGAKTSGPITIALVVSLLGGAFAFGNIYFMSKETREETKEQITRIERVQSAAKSELNAQIAAIMENANANSVILADSFKSQMELSHKLFNSELEKRDVKLEIAYESANKGPRHTLAMATEHEKDDQARAELCDARYYETRQTLSELQHNCKDTMAKVSDIEAQHTGLGYHSGSNGGTGKQ